MSIGCLVTYQINWRGKPLLDRETVVNLIGNIKTEKGLTVRAVLDQNHYETFTKIIDEEMKTLKIKVDSFHPEWNYQIFPEGKL